MKLTLDPRPHRVDELPQRRLLVGSEPEVVRLVASGHDERVAAGQRERVGKGGDQLVLDGEVTGREAIAEDAAHGSQGPRTIAGAASPRCYGAEGQWTPSNVEAHPDGVCLRPPSPLLRSTVTG